jgi:hypothetical protein
MLFFDHAFALCMTRSTRLPHHVATKERKTECHTARVVAKMNTLGKWGAPIYGVLRSRPQRKGSSLTGARRRGSIHAAKLATVVPEDAVLPAQVGCRSLSARPCRHEPWRLDCGCPNNGTAASGQSPNPGRATDCVYSRSCRFEAGASRHSPLCPRCQRTGRQVSDASN